MRARILNTIGAWLEALSRWADKAASAVKVCPDCGRNLYPGPACRGRYLTGCNPPQ